MVWVNELMSTIHRRYLLYSIGLLISCWLLFCWWLLLGWWVFSWWIFSGWLFFIVMFASGILTAKLLYGRSVQA